ncbi:DUF4221 family protein [Sphingobacterium sp. DR205]|uniref:DUF4221 family protein n=1 Tax=Sphingobacterium sp. DR205 TaxID=2713573 RepID=UPI0013E4F7B1|nr:DUF4221 family protein [Sphingobacterium sp. DR205]QIH35983.1 DUF4221 family protein [Sphingobacterium sp. DR205]
MNNRLINSLRLLLLCSTIYGCSGSGDNPVEYKDENAKSYKKNATLELTDSYLLPVDENTDSKIYGIDIFKDKNDNTKTISFLNPSSKSILLFDFDKKAIIKKVPLFQEGRNSMGAINLPSMHKVISKDSILFFNMDYLNVLNTNGDLLDRVQLVSENSIVDNSPKPNPSTNSPIIYKNGTAYLLCAYNVYYSPQNEIKDLLKVNLANKEIKPLFNRINLYNYGFWGHNMNLYYLYGAQNSKENSLVMGYAADPHLYTFSLNDEKVTPSQFIGSENFKSIDPFLSNKNDKTLNPSHDDMAKSAEYELTNPSYYSVFYDDINDVYVRLAYLPRTKSEYRDPLTRYKFKYSAIIMDNKFNKIGETVLPDATELDYRMIFFDNGYMYVFNKKKYNEDNNNLYFDRYKLKKDANI